MGMTNQQKLQTLRNLTGPELFSVIVKELGSGPVYIPPDGDGAIREPRNLKIQVDFLSSEFEGEPLGKVYQVLAERYNLSTRQIKRILKQHTSGSR